MNEPYDKNYILAHMNYYGTHAKKSFGQNFLISHEISKIIVDSLKLQEDDVCLEIGPGLGALTFELYKKTKNLKLIEIDEVLSGYLKEKYPSADVLNIDFLKYDFKNLNQKIKIVGNLPYNITTDILEKLIKNNDKISAAVLMIQKEAYERFISLKNSKSYGPMSIFLEYLGGVQLIKKVSRHAFFPEPHVDSVVFKIECKKTRIIKEEDKFFKIVKAMFLMKRKTILNNLTNYLRDKNRALEILESINIAANLRPENLSLNDFIALSEKI